MANYVINYEQNRLAAAAGLDLLPATLREGLGAAIEQELTRGPTEAGLRAIERARYEESTFLDEFGNVTTIPAVPSRILTAKEASEQYGLGGALTFDEDTPEPVAKQLYDLKIREIISQDTQRRADTGFGTSLLAGVIASVRDPIYLGSAFIPVVGEARFTAMAGRIGVGGARVATGAIEGAVGAAMVEPMVLAGAMAEQADYTAADSLSNIVFGSVVGGGLHLGAGYIGDRWAGRASATPLAREFDDLAVEDRAAVITAAAEQFEARRPVDVQAVVDVAVHQVQDRRKFDIFRDDINAIDDPVERARIVDELRTAALVDPRTGLGNMRALMVEMAEMDVKGPYHVLSMDVSGLKWVNDNMAEDVGTQMIQVTGERMGAIGQEMGLKVHAPKGDEFYALSTDAAKLEELARRTKESIKDAVFEWELPDGTVIRKTGVDVYVGIGRSKTDADAKLNESKAHVKAALKERLREQGIHDERLAEPGGVVRIPPSRRQAESNLSRWTDSQRQAHVAPELAAGMKAAETDAKLEAGPPKELGDLISETEAELLDIERSLSEEDYARFDAEPEEGTPTVAQIQAMENSAPAYDKAVQQAANCLPGRR